MDDIQEKAKNFTQSLILNLPNNEQIHRVRAGILYGMPELLGLADNGKISKENRVQALQAFEKAVLCCEKDKQQGIRKKAVIFAPRFFSDVYGNYQIPEDRKKFMNRIMHEIVLAVHEGGWGGNILDPNFDQFSVSEKKSLLQNIADYLANHSGIEGVDSNLPYQTVEIVPKAGNLLGSYRDREGEWGKQWGTIRIGEDQLNKKELWDTFFHEFWHNRQHRSARWQQGSFEDIAQNYYVSGGESESNSKWGNSSYQIYQNQPQEAEAWYLGSEMQKNFIRELTQLREQDKWYNMENSSAIAKDYADHGGGSSITPLQMHAYLNKLLYEVKEYGNISGSFSSPQDRERDKKIESSIDSANILPMDKLFSLDDEEIGPFRKKDKKLERFLSSCKSPIIVEAFAQRGYLCAQKIMEKRAEDHKDWKNATFWAKKIYHNQLANKREVDSFYKSHQEMKSKSAQSKSTLRERLSVGEAQGDQLLGKNSKESSR